MGKRDREARQEGQNGLLHSSKKKRRVEDGHLLEVTSDSRQGVPGERADGVEPEAQSAKGSPSLPLDAAREDKALRKEKKRLRAEKKRLAELADSNDAEKTLNGHATEYVTASSQEKNGQAPTRTEKSDKKKRKHREEKRNGDAAASSVLSEPSQTTNGGLENMSYHESKSLSDVSKAEVDAFLSQNFISIEDPKSSNLKPILGFQHLPRDCNHSAMFKSFKSPTPIQAATWPFLLSKRDVIGIAETGSGKTLAFGVPCARHVSSRIAESKESKPVIRAVMVSPTRELALQIHEQMTQLLANTKLRAVCIYGGMPKQEQRSAMALSHIIIATPGRLNDFIQEGSADLSNVSYLVLDEADRMLDKGFEQDIRKIVGEIPVGQAQTAMFTATWPPSIRELAEQFMKDPVKINIGDNPSGELRANLRVTQKVEVLDPREKEQRLLQLLKQYQSGKNKQDRILIFCLYKKEAARIESFIRSRGFAVAGIHGDMNQSARTQSLDGFRDGSVPLLVATDVAARGLDIPAVKLVINVTL